MCILLAISCCYGCKHDNRPHESNRGSVAFAPVLKDKIEEFIFYNDSIRSYPSKNEFFYVSFWEREDKMLVFVGTDFFYQKDKIKGYAYMNGRLVVYNGNPTKREQHLVDTTKLIQFVDSIPNYWSDDDNIGMDYEVLRREFVIYGKDSLSWVIDRF